MVHMCSHTSQTLWKHLGFTGGTEFLVEQYELGSTLVSYRGGASGWIVRMDSSGLVLLIAAKTNLSSLALQEYGILKPV